MKAYNLCMLIIFINASAFLLGSLGIFPGMDTSNFGAISSLLGENSVAIPIIAFAMMSGTVVFLGSRPITAQGVSYITFSAVFWASFVLSAGVFRSIPLPGIDMIFTIFTVACTLIFIVALIQLPTGGMKSHE